MMDLAGADGMDDRHMWVCVVAGHEFVVELTSPDDRFYPLPLATGVTQHRGPDSIPSVRERAGCWDGFVGRGLEPGGRCDGGCL